MPRRGESPSDKPTQDDRRAAPRGLIEWYRRNRRALPWRNTRDPYAIWVSEVMLQQTVVRTVLPRYAPFLALFPSIERLARAPVESVLAAWSGLGYYHRARNLHRGAQYILEHHGGQFPRELPAALAVPGVGLYTASAVLSIAFDLPLAVVDGNVRRVLARLFALSGREWQRDAAFYNLASELLERGAPGDWNQAMMELGATVCMPTSPACAACPVASACQARRQGIQEQLPEGRARRKPVAVTVAAALIQSEEGVLLVRRPEGRLLGRLWEIPQTSLESKGVADLATELAERHGLSITRGPLLGVARHSITFRRIRVEVYSARLARPAPADAEHVRWATLEQIADLPISSMTHKILLAGRRQQAPLAFE